MPVLQVKDPNGVTALRSSDSTDLIPPGLDVSDELDVMVQMLKRLNTDRPDVIMSTCMSLMARCTELHLQLFRAEMGNRRNKVIRTMELEKVIDLVEFMFRGASRIVEIRRQDTELSR